MFRTEITITPQERQFSRSARVLTVGSCFADSIGERLRLNKVNALVNPFGTVFQPLALAKLLRAAAGEEQDWQQHVVEARGRWQSYDFHSTLGADSPVELLQLIQQRVQQVRDFLRQTDAVLLTLGTAWAYRLRETGELISNLHKLPASLFEKELLTADEIVNGLAEVHALLRLVNPHIRIVLTVSPVRHIKDTLPFNTVSKSVLRVACHYLSELLPGVSYFPAYELLNDELRDYRFYAADMLHPSEVAEEYIWDKFARAYFDADFGRFRKEWAAVRQSLTHRPLHLGAPEHRTFLDQTAERLERLANQGVEVRYELRDVQRQLAALPPPRPVRQPEPIVEDDGEERIDIGSEDTITAGLSPAATDASAFTERSRESRGRNRRGRGRDRDRNQRIEQPFNGSSPEAKVEDAELVASQPLAELVEAELPTLEAESIASVPELTSVEEADNYPAQKKKRRSRGGAKRTARKHAARLAAEQGLGSPDSSLLDAEAEVVDAGPAEELLLLADTPANESSLIDTPDGIQAPLISEALHDPIVEPAAERAPEAEEAADAVQTTDAEAEASAAAEAAETTEPAPVEPATATRRRGTGPTPKKSKVIAKSTQVRRPKRTSLFRSAAPVEPTTETPAQAPIISTPILPEALLERPAVTELLENPVMLAAAIEPPSAPPKPKRGRAKAGAAPTAEPATEEPAPPKPKRAARPKTASAAAPRRGRPPGKKTPPPEEAS